MKPRTWIAVFLLTLPLVGVRAEVVAPPGPFQGFKSTDKTPVEIHADRMEAELGSHKLRFLGHVTAKQGERMIYAEQMDVQYTEKGKVTMLEAKVNVKVNMGKAFATSDRLVLDNVKQVIQLFGRPKVVQGSQMIIGDKMVYEIVTERLVVTNPHIEWKPEPEPEKPGGGK